MSDIQAIFDRFERELAHLDRKSGYAQGVRAVLDALRGALPPSKPKTAQAPDPAPETPEEPSSQAADGATQSFRPPVGTFRRSSD